MEKVKDLANSAADNIKGAYEATKDAVSDSFEGARDHASNAVDETKRAADDGVAGAKEMKEDCEENVDQVFKEYQVIQSDDRELVMFQEKAKCGVPDSVKPDEIHKKCEKAKCAGCDVCRSAKDGAENVKEGVEQAASGVRDSAKDMEEQVHKSTGDALENTKRESENVMEDAMKATKQA